MNKVLSEPIFMVPVGRFKTTFPVIILALLLATGFSYKFFPGFMSFDSFAQYRQTLGLHELNDAHPVIMVYLWRLLLKIHDSPGVLLVFWQLIYWLGIALFACLVMRRLLGRMVVLLIIGLCPPLVILSLHLWKDVGMMCALAVAVTALLGYVRYSNYAWLITSVLALFFAIAIRINGFIPAVPLLLLASYFYASRQPRSKWQTPGLTASVFLLSVIVYGAAMSLINSDAKKTYGLGTLIVWDMVSISLAENEDLLPKYLDRSLGENILPLLHAANSTEANYPSYKVVSPYPPKSFRKQLVRDWLNLIMTHPNAYLQHRAHILGVMLGIQDREIYYPYHPGIDENEFNIWFSNMTREELTGYFHLFNKFAASCFYRPWVYTLFGLIAVVVSGFRLLKRSGSKKANLLAGTVALSGLSSAGSLLFIATAADYRYITWTILAALLANVILASDMGSSAQKKFGV